MEKLYSMYDYIFWWVHVYVFIYMYICMFIYYFCLFLSYVCVFDGCKFYDGRMLFSNVIQLEMI